MCPVDDQPAGLRLIDDEGRWLETENETLMRARAEERAAAEVRIRELEEQLRRSQGGGSSA